ncbi:hypothetical protein AMTRI_Chr09g13980 [Amborella trichopoda]|nr:diphthine methyltransferase isoform X2 [Amborella trichopoda]|eukprot:XP_011627529.1 diphthine methyltransferase isoform X2 [Amborella trichopoda]
MDIAQYRLDGNADAVEFCPNDPFHHILAAATYTLQEGDHPCRLGSISLFSIKIKEGLKLLQHVETSGVFDIKWNPSHCNIHPQLAQADSDGYLTLHGLQCSSSISEFDGEFLQELCKTKISSSMCLCLDWSPSAKSIATGLSDGSMAISTLREGSIHPEKAWKAHDFELWSASFDTQQPELIYTGADDCKFAGWDVRESTTKPIFQNSKTHKMGVCSISKCPNSLNLLLTGSYDEHLRLWDVRSMQRPIVEEELCLGGGVWRIKHHPYLEGLLLAACMHNGFSIIRIKDGVLEIVERYDRHESLAYGADWQKVDSSQSSGIETKSFAATCSFYDQCLRVWIPKNS